ncbi:methyltransferase, TIGR04325 family protein [Verrucomicrobiota bacterium]|nr:methyltransferase, TIGR04325 family protein [Verrucomicrobiota bacterium]
MSLRKLKRWFRAARGRSAPAANSGEIRFVGSYPTWAAATQDATGYDAVIILEKTKAALLKVKNGEAVYERDSVLFDKIQHAFPVLAGLLRAAQAHDGRLCVVDFGGALGSSYFQCRGFLKVIRQLEWLVVEQAAHVTCGKEHFASAQLHFHPTIEECLTRHQPNALLLSSVLQYVSDPYGLLKSLLRHKISHVIIDRTAFLQSDRERLTVQHVPSAIYPASYPAWFFSESQFHSAVTAAGYQLVADFPGTDDISPEGEKAYFKGFIYEWRG